MTEAHTEITCNNSKLSPFNSRTNQCEFEAQKIIHLQDIANQLIDVFNNSKNVVKSHISIVALIFF